MTSVSIRLSAPRPLLQLTPPSPHRLAHGTKSSSPRQRTADISGTLALEVEPAHDRARGLFEAALAPEAC